MMLPNHVIGGFALTGIIGGLCGENVFATKANIICTVLCAILPDIDNPKSPVSYLCRPLSIWLSRHYGHRTITHSLPALVIVGFVAYAFSFCGIGVSTLICTVAYFSHLLLDMATFMGVPLLYPSKEPWYLLPNPRYRIQTGKYGTEAAAFGAFCLLSSFTYPLTEKGFWTVYNQSFSTMKTTHNEFRKSTDLLEVEYAIQTASKIDTAKGFLIESSENLATIWQNGKFVIVDDSKQIVKFMKPNHTGKRFFVGNLGFVGISTDSLNNLLKGKKILEIKANSNNQFNALQNGIPEKVSSLNARLIESLTIQSLDIEARKDSIFTMPNFEEKRIRVELQNLEAENRQRLAAYNEKRNRAAEIEKVIVTATNLEREKLMKERDELNRAEKPVFDEFRKASLETQLSIIVQRYALENEQKRFERELKYQDEIRRTPPTQFVGFVKYFSFQ